MYKVELFQDNTYQVVYYIKIFDTVSSVRDIKFQGSISDCNAWLQLNDKGYI